MIIKSCLTSKYTKQKLNKLKGYIQHHRLFDVIVSLIKRVPDEIPVRIYVQRPIIMSVKWTCRIHMQRSNYKACRMDMQEALDL